MGMVPVVEGGAGLKRPCSEQAWATGRRHGGAGKTSPRWDLPWSFILRILGSSADSHTAFPLECPSSILGPDSLFDFALTEGPWAPQGLRWVLGKEGL